MGLTALATAAWVANESVTLCWAAASIEPFIEPPAPIACHAPRKPVRHLQSTWKTKDATSLTVSTGVLAPMSDGCTPFSETEAKGDAGATMSLYRPNQPRPSEPEKSATLRK